MNSHSDDMPTDISSSLSSPFGNSFSRKRATTASSQVERLDEADKQILEWAGKLEMESVDLREKSSQLMQVLRSNSDDLSILMKKLNGVLARQGDAAEVRSSIGELATRLQEILSAIERLENVPQKTPESCKGPENFDLMFKKLESKISDALDDRNQRHTESIEQTQMLLFNVSQQLDDTHHVMTSMSRDIKSLHERQTSLEKHLMECEAALKGCDDNAPTITEIDDGPTLLNDGRITRSMSKKRTKSIAMKRVVKPRDTAITRTIIPWEEVEMYYASEL